MLGTNDFQADLVGGSYEKEIGREFSVSVVTVTCCEDNVLNSTS